MERLIEHMHPERKKVALFYIRNRDRHTSTTEVSNAIGKSINSIFSARTMLISDDGFEFDKKPYRDGRVNGYLWKLKAITKTPIDAPISDYQKLWRLALGRKDHGLKL